MPRASSWTAASGPLPGRRDPALVDPADGRAEFQDSPLLLVPMRLDAARAGAIWKLLPTEEESLVNPALWLKLENDLGIELPELDPEEPLEVAPLLDVIRSAVAERPTWSVEERVVLSTFSFHKEAMYRDLRENFELIAAHPIVGALAAGPEGEATFDFAPVSEAVARRRLPAGAGGHDPRRRRLPAPVRGRGARGPLVRDGRPARHRQEPDDREHDRRADHAREDRPVRVREGGGAGRRAQPPRARRAGRVRARAALAQDDPRRGGARRSAPRCCAAPSRRLR